MNIGQAAKASGISAKMIRYYESIGLIRHSRRSEAGYRNYDEADVHMLRFILRARKLGFALEQIRALLSLWQNTARSSAEVKSVVQAHIVELDTRIAELSEMRDTLKALADTCSGDQRPECPILHGIACEDGQGQGHSG
jgi:MerR family copper efflux transcriptional regulator